MSAIDRAQRRALSSFTLHHVSADFQSEVVPTYSSSVFTIEDFSRMRNNADPIYSPPLVVDGLKWRLKVRRKLPFYNLHEETNCTFCNRFTQTETASCEETIYPFFLN